jgi:excisionase family DNA binding protein
MTRYLSESDACEILGVSIHQLRRIRERREIAWYKFGGTVHFKEEDIEDYAERQRTKALDKPSLFPMEVRRGPGRPQKTYESGYVPGMKVV